jgi:type VI secretion system secreted protein Hcp
MAIYMKFGSISGDVTTEGFKDWISLESLSFGVGRGIGSATGGATNREASAPSISEVSITKKMDVASAQLFQDATLGTLDTKVEIKLTTTTKNKTEVFLAYELTNCGCSSYSVSSGGDMPQESLSLNFTKIMMTFSGMDPATKASPKSATYDLSTIQVS